MLSSSSGVTQVSSIPSETHINDSVFLSPFLIFFGFSYCFFVDTNFRFLGFLFENA